MTKALTMLNQPVNSLEMFYGWQMLIAKVICCWEMFSLVKKKKGVILNSRPV